MRAAHSRFMKNTPVAKGQEFDRVVTSVWTFDHNTRVLTYGATIYRKENSHDSWDKNLHLKRAIERFNDNPIRIVLKARGGMKELSPISVDWYIGEKLIYQFGAYNKNEVDVRRIHGEVIIPDDFNVRFSLLAKPLMRDYQFNYRNYFDDEYNTETYQLCLSVTRVALITLTGSLLFMSLT